PQMVASGPATVMAEHPDEGPFTFASDGVPALLFTENDTNNERIFGAPNPSPYVKDAFHEYLIRGRAAAVNPAHVGTKVAAHHHLVVEGGAEAVVRLRLPRGAPGRRPPFADFDEAFAARIRQADAFYDGVIPADLSDDARAVMRQAFAGLLWSKQF